MSDFVLNIATKINSKPVFRSSGKTSGGWKEKHKQKKLERHKFRKSLKVQKEKTEIELPTEVKHKEKDKRQAVVEDFDNAIMESNAFFSQSKNTSSLALNPVLESKQTTAPKSDQRSKNSAHSSGSGANAPSANTTRTSSLFSGMEVQDGNQTVRIVNEEKFGQNNYAPTEISNSVTKSKLKFSDLGILPALSSHLKAKLNISKPTEIQKIVLFNSFKNTTPIGTNSSPKINYKDRDILIRAETGTGKTLAYSLPIINRLLLATSDVTNTGVGSNDPPAANDLPSRNLGTLAIVLTPTRELAKQVYETTLSLINISRSSQDNTEESGKDSVQSVKSHWIVPGLVIGGDKKTSEKARLRKGTTILACTPGRLLDHLKSTNSFNVSNLRWLVLDECDLLLELGFHETLKEILELLESKSDTTSLDAKGKFMTSKHTPTSRINILCSATLKDNVKKLADISLNNPLVLSSTKRDFPNSTFQNNNSDSDDNSDDESATKASTLSNETKALEKAKNNQAKIEKNMEIISEFAVPTQLLQEFLITPPKLKLVSLAALLRFFVKGNSDAKVIVFLSCKDEVDFFFDLFSHTNRALLNKKSAESLNEETGFNDKQKEKSRFDDDNSDVDLDKDSKDNIDEDVQDNADKKANSAEVKSDDNNSRHSKKNYKNGFGKSKYGKGGEGGDDKNQHAVSNYSCVLDNTTIFRLHGSLPQHLRSDTVSKFTAQVSSKDESHSGESKGARVLFCTDVAARGLDMPEISHIIQYDPPTDIASYVHRVGRTARIGGFGRAVLMLLPTEIEYLNLLDSNSIKLSRISYSNTSGDEAKNEEKNGVKSFVSAFYREGGNSIAKSVTNSVELEQLLKINCLINKQKTGKWMDYATDLQMGFENYVTSHESRLQLAQTAFSSSVRAYATHTPAEKHIFHIKHLHLGHLAKSFGLRQAPKTISVGNKIVSTSKSQKKVGTGNDGKPFGKKRTKPSEVSEFAIGATASMTGPRTKKFKRY